MLLLAYSNAKMRQQPKKVCCRRLDMAVPDYQSLMLPFLKIAADGSEHHLSEIIETLAQQFDVSDQDRKEMLPSGRQQRFDNRVRWACTYLAKAHLVTRTGRSRFRITERGIEVL